MNTFRCFRTRGADESGQAIVEYAIVMPIFLLLFLGILQYFQVFRASQLANYAAYCAARSYAVHASVDGPAKAKETALDAASMALSPVARLVPGELAGIGSLTRGNAGVFALAEGYFTAKYLRLNPKALGGSIEIKTSQPKGLPKQVDVEINYPQPIFIPGLNGLWAIVGGGSDMRSDLLPASEDLEGVAGFTLKFSKAVPGWVGRLFPQFKDALVERFGKMVGKLFYPYVNVRAKCSMGYEDWGNQNGTAYAKYMPRMPRTVVDAGQTAADRRDEAEANDFKQNAEGFQGLADAERQKCADWRAAKVRLASAEQTYNSTPATPPAAKQSALAALQRARTTESSAKAAYEAARNRRRNAQSQLESQSGQFGDEPTCEN